MTIHYYFTLIDLIQWCNYQFFRVDCDSIPWPNYHFTYALEQVRIHMISLKYNLLHAGEVHNLSTLENLFVSYK